jgi:hypothetical protein
MPGLRADFTGTTGSIKRLQLQGELTKVMGKERTDAVAYLPT